MPTELLVRIKRCALANRLRFTEKARTELDADDLYPEDIREALVAAHSIYETISSTNPINHRREMLVIIRSRNFSGTNIYTKGKVQVIDGVDTFMCWFPANSINEIDHSEKLPDQLLRPRSPCR